MKIRVLLVDDHQMMREGLSLMLNSQDEIQVVGEAENGRAAVQLAQRLNPDVVVMDVSMPDLNGVDATRQILARIGGPKVVGLSMHADRQFAMEMRRAGASGYMLKDSSLEEFVRVIRGVMRGETFFNAKIPGLSANFCGSADSIFESAPSAPRLSEREREVLQLLAEGKGTKEIASALFLSAKTVETHRQHVMEKLHIRTIAGLTKFAIRSGLTSL